MKSGASQIAASSRRRTALICSSAVLATLGALGGSSNQAFADLGMTNLAVGKTATATNSDFGGTPDKGVDGNRDGNFGNGSVYYGNSPASEGTDTNPSTTYFYQVDLGQNSYVNRIQFLPRTDADQNVFGNFNLSLYPDDGTGHPAATPSYSQNYNSTYFGDSFATTDPSVAASGGAYGRFARITRLDNNYWLTFAEMEVIGSNTPLQYTAATNLAANKPVTTSSPPGFGALIISGNDNNISGDFNDPNRPVYHSASHSVGEYWQVDLGSNTALSYAELFCRAGQNNNSTSQFNVQVYDSSMNLIHSELVNNSDVNGSTPGYDHTIDLTGVTGEFIRLSTTSDSYLSFSELEAFAAPPGVSARWATDSGDWNVPSNWESGVVPSGVDATALFARAGSNNQTVYSNSAITVGTLRFNSANNYVIAGAGPLTLQTSTGTALVDVLQGNQKVNLPVIVARSTNINVAAGATLRISDPITINSGVTVTQSGSGSVFFESTVTVLSGGSLALGNSNHVAALTLNSGASATLASGNNKTLRADSLSISGQLDLKDNRLITPAAVGTVAGGVYSGVAGLIQSGRNGGSWTGNGIVTSQAAAHNSNFTTLGVARASDVRPSTAGATGLWNGQTITGTDTLVMYTYGGDATLDGKINVDDYIRIDSGISAGLTGWSNGDFNYDGKVNIDDYTQFIDANIGIQGAALGSSAGALSDSGVAAVPEPAAALGIFSSCMAAAALRRRRSRAL